MGNNCCLYASTEDLNAKQVKENSLEDRKLNEPAELPHISDREGNEIFYFEPTIGLCYLLILLEVKNKLRQ